MTASEPLLSFCVPTFRRPALLAETLRSILALRGLDAIVCEVVVSDDDESGDLRAELPRDIAGCRMLRICKNRAHGQFPNLNNLIEASRGEWIVFLHDDDLLDPRFLESLRDSGLLEDPETEAVWFGRQLIDHAGRPLRRLLAKRHQEAPVHMSGIEYTRRWLVARDYIFSGLVIFPMVTGMLARRGLLRRVGGFPTHLTTMGDGLFLANALSEARRASYIDEPMVMYRVYVGTQRSIASEKGYVYDEFKSMIMSAIEFASARVPGDRADFVRRATREFYVGALRVDGPIAWLALHYRGPLRVRLKILSGILSDVRRHCPGLLLRRFPVWRPLLCTSCRDR